MKVTIKVTPGARSERIAIDKAGMLHCYVHAPPEDGKANAAVLKLLAEALACPKSVLSVVRGHTSRVKIIEIPVAATLEELYERLGLSEELNEQKGIFG